MRAKLSYVSIVSITNIQSYKRSFQKQSARWNFFNSILLWTWITFFKLDEIFLKHTFSITLICCQIPDFRLFQFPSEARSSTRTLIERIQWFYSTDDVVNLIGNTRWLKFCPKQWQEKLSKAVEATSTFCTGDRAVLANKKSFFPTRLREYFVFWLWVKIIS